MDAAGPDLTVCASAVRREEGYPVETVINDPVFIAGEADDNDVVSVTNVTEDGDRDNDALGKFDVVCKFDRVNYNAVEIFSHLSQISKVSFPLRVDKEEHKQKLLMFIKSSGFDTTRDILTVTLRSIARCERQSATSV